METIKSVVRKLQTYSLLKSNQQRGERELFEDLEEIVPSLKDQYTSFSIEEQDSYLKTKVRCLHAFQIKTVLKALSMVKAQGRPARIVDIGDSSGTHLTYLKQIAAKTDQDIEALSVNLDPNAIEKLESKDLKGILCRAEELHLKHPELQADVFMMFEALEHLLDPISFLHDLSTKGKLEYFVVTVPYVQTSRIGLHHLRRGWSEPVRAEQTHIFELSPEDWKLAFNFAGWSVVHEEVYRQYPNMSLLSPMKYLWKKYDFEGFYAVILKATPQTANQYTDWPS